jgi:cytochrome P450
MDYLKDHVSFQHNATSCRRLMNTLPDWDNRSNSPSMIAQRDPALHAGHRHRWAHAFTTTALKDYEASVIARVRQLSEKWEMIIRGRVFGEKGATIDISAWMTYFA